MEDSRLSEEIIGKLRNPFPVRLILLTATPQRTQPEAFYSGPECQQGAEVCWHCVVRRFSRRAVNARLGRGEHRDLMHQQC
jgi:hypothetical protein